MGAARFNKEIFLGEVGALLTAYLAGTVASRYSPNPAIISGSVVVGTLIGGTAFWLTARIRHLDERGWALAQRLARDIAFFTPAALVFGLIVYDPTIYFTSHYLLARHTSLALAVIVAEIAAFVLFLTSMNAYRALLVRLRGPKL